MDKPVENIIVIHLTDILNHTNDDSTVVNVNLIHTSSEVTSIYQLAINEFKRLANEGKYPEFLVFLNNEEGIHF